METDDQQPTQENSDKAASDDQETSQPRSYECNFCKRGFSNAQALGGHMNIHRKDKAKLKQFSSNQTQQSSPIPKNTSTIQWPWVFGQDKSEEGHVGEVRQLPLFAEAPTDSEEEKPSSFVGDDKQEKGLEELDLELRLGTPEHQDSSATTGTKKFF